MLIQVIVHVWDARVVTQIGNQALVKFASFLFCFFFVRKIGGVKNGCDIAAGTNDSRLEGVIIVKRKGSSGRWRVVYCREYLISLDTLALYTQQTYVILLSARI